ncbi:MAG TPA: acyl-CoA dehydrogenase [Polyangiaceae bacterium]|nr:acyl-CoA dehydrogenase [Polyangiaceae bacterium]
MKPTWKALPPFFDAVHTRLGDDLSLSLRRETFVEDSPGRIVERLAALGVFRLLRTCDSVRALCVAREILAYRSSVADAIFAVQGLAAATLNAADPERWKGYLQDAAAGRLVGGFAATEPEAGSDIASMRTLAIPRGDGWAIDGHKTFVANIGIASFFIVFATVDPARGKKGITAFVVQANDPGVEAQALDMMDGHPVGRLVLHGARGELLGPIGKGLRLGLGTLEIFRATVGAAAVGMAQRAFDEAIGHTQRRVQFGQPLANFQLVQADLAEMATELEAARLLVARAAWGKDVGSATSAEVAMAKLFATEAAQRIVDRAVQLHGGLGVERGSVVERLYRAVRSLRIYEGTSEIQKLIIARSLLDEARNETR